MKHCLNCKAEIEDTPGRRPKQFCGANCRQKYWQKKNREGKEPGKPGRPKNKKNDIPLPTGYVRLKNVKAITGDGKEVALFKPANQPSPPLDITPMTYNDYLREAPITKDKDSFKYRVQSDKKLNSRQRDMIYSKLK